MTTWLWSGFTLGVLLIGVAIYGRGWLRVRRFAPAIATEGRLLLFLFSTLLMAVAHLPPLTWFSEQLLWVRALQKVILCLLAPPLFWLACPFPLVAWGLPRSWRYGLTRALLRATPLRQRLQALTHPGVVWLVFVSTFLVWHDTNFVNWSMSQLWSQQLALWGLGLVALLFWWHVVQTGPRLHRQLPGWVFFAYLIGADIPNMVCGVTISFSATPLYRHYAAAHAAATHPFAVSALEDQMISGGVIWVSGSLSYFFSAVLVIRKLFLDHHSDAPQPFPDWDSDERMIAPGLEHRVRQKRYQEAYLPKGSGQ